MALNKLGAVQLEKLSKWKKEQQQKTDFETRNKAAWTSPIGKPKPKQKDRAAHIHSLGISRSAEHLPEIINALKDPNGNVRRMAASALGKMRSCEAVEPLLALLEVETKPQVRQYSIKALGKIRDERARATLEIIVNDSSEKEYNRKSARTALRRINRTEAKPLEHPSFGNKQPESPQANHPPKQPRDPITNFLNQPRPRPLKGPWFAGWALDYHSRYVGRNQIRSAVGTLVYNYKYQGEHHLADDLVDRWVVLLALHPDLPQPQVVIPIPPSTLRKFDPVSHLAERLASRLDIPAMINTLGKTRTTQPQKELNSLVAKQRNVSGAFHLKGDVTGLHLLLIDDLFDSGATLCEAARTLSQGHPASIVVLTLTKTIHSNQ
jgi:predicted amidophosphoribosyltransferase